MNTKAPLGHLQISRGEADAIVASIAESVTRNEKSYCIPINITKYGMSKSDAKLRNVINAAGYVIADGLPISWLARRRGYHDVQRLTGIRLAEELLAKAAETGWRVFFLGTTAENLSRAVETQKQRHPSLIVAGSHDGFYGADAEEVVREINASHANLLLLGLGLPQKEYFIADYWQAINADFCIAVGGALDVWAGAKRRAPRVVQTFGFEWLYRSCYDIRKSTSLFRHGFTYLKDFYC